MRLFDVATGRETAVLKGHTLPVTALTFAPDGRTLASGGADGTVRLWDVSLEKQIATFVGHSASVDSISFTPDGGTAVSAWGPGTEGVGEVIMWTVPAPGKSQ